VRRCQSPGQVRDFHGRKKSLTISGQVLFSLTNYAWDRITDETLLAVALRAAHDTRALEIGNGILNKTPEIFGSSSVKRA